MNNDCAEVDGLLLEIEDFKDDFANVAAEKHLGKCSTSWDANHYLRDRVHGKRIRHSLANSNLC